jgi:hypothetical protein
MMGTIQKYATFAFLAGGIIVGGLVSVDFRSASSILTALVPIFAGLAGLTQHPPWIAVAPPPGAAPPV